MRIRCLVVLLILVLYSVYSDAPYWVFTEDEQFLTDKKDLGSFTLVYVSFGIKFSREVGDKIAEKSFVVDSLGNIVRESFHDYSDNTILNNVYNYDGSNRIVSEQLVAPDGRRFTVADYSYEENTRIKNEYSLNGLSWQKREIYDAKDRVIESTDYNASGAVVTSFRFKYDSDKNVTDRYDMDGNLKSRSILLFKEGRPVRREDYYNGSLDKAIDYAYNQLGQLENEVGWDSKGNMVFEYEYTYTGEQRTTEKRVNYSDEREFLISYEYDSSGLLKSVTNCHRVNKFGKKYYETEYIIERTQVK